ncbi:PPT1 [Symbiodinium microadriaticum]|nr:PPT1 [Symbiodinium sp. KB8]CAE7317296.1 PPT1 [Symbiodinium microadriaticum]
MAVPQAHVPHCPPPAYPAAPPGYEQAVPQGPPGLDEPRLRMPQDMLSHFSQRVNHATGHAELQVVAELRRMESSMNALADKVRRVEMLLSQKDKAHLQSHVEQNLSRNLAGERRRSSDAGQVL